MGTDLNHKRRAKLVLAVVGALVVGVAVASATGTAANKIAAPRLQGTIGPGFTISLKRGVARVRLLKAGRYTFVVSDKSSIHNFTLNGPGVANKTITATGFVGSRAVTLSLRKGTYRFYCTVHPTVTGSFRVT